MSSNGRRLRSFMKVDVRWCAALSVVAGNGCAAKPAPCAAVTPTAAAPATAPEPAQHQATEGVPEPRPAGMVYAFIFGDQELVIDPSDGARTVGFKLAGKNVLLERQDNPEAYGSSFWTSPQSDWGWPPPPELAGKAWAVETGGSALLLRSKPVAKLSIEVSERVSVDLAKQFATFEYSIKNAGSTPKKIAPWQNTRVAPGGLTLYPSGGALSAESTLKFDTAGEIAFFKHDPSQFKNGVKSFGDGKEGWLAHVSGELVLIKTFPDVPREQQAPKEAEIELYVDGAGQFVEVEQQGPYTELQPGASSTWTVKWYLRKLPPGVKGEAASKELVDFIRASIR